MSRHDGRSRQLIGALMVAVAAVAFSGKTIIVKLAYRYGVDAITLLALRMLYAAPMFLALALWASTRDGTKRLSARERWQIAAVGLLGYYLASLFDFLGLQYITAALERLVLFLYPTFVVMFSTLFFGYRIHRREVLGLVASYGGIVLVFLNDLEVQQTDVVLGTLWVLLSALCYAAYLIGSGRMVERTGSVRFASLASLAACVGVGAHFAVVRDVTELVAPVLPVHGLALLMAAVSTVLPIVLTSEGIRRLGSSKAAMIGTLGPVATIFLGYFFLDEPITPIQLGGAALVMTGVLMIGLARYRIAREIQPAAVGESAVREKSEKV